METKGKVRNQIILAISTFFILSIIIAGLCVYFLVEKEQSKIILLALLVCIIIFGISISLYIECERRKSQQKKERGVNTFREENYEAQYSRPEPSAPPRSERTSWTWALMPRKWSTATQLPPYSR